MPKPVQYTRKVANRNIIKGYSKSFEVTTEGIQLAEQYQNDHTNEKIDGEVLNYKINMNTKTIWVYMGEKFPLKHYKVIGTISLSRVKGIYTSTGAFYKGFGEIIKEVINNIPKVAEFTIDYRRDSNSKVTKRKDKSYVSMSYKDYDYIHGIFQLEKNYTVDNTKIEIIKYLRKKIRHIRKSRVGSGKDLVSRDFKKLIFEEVLNTLNEKDLHALVKDIYEKRMINIDDKIDLFRQTDTYKLDFVIKKYEGLLKKHPSSELKWQEFYEKYFSIIIPGYKYVIREVDTIFEAIDLEASRRPVDFVVVDIYNNVELIELKTPDTPLISNRKNRNNYFLMQDCTKACTQIEKYLMCIESNKNTVETHIKKKISKKYNVLQKDINLVIMKPKAKLVIGNLSKILRSESRHKDLQLQRNAFKNIELITFDEILNSMKEIRVELNRKIVGE